MAIGFTPLAILLAFILRIVTFNEHISPIIPFTMPDQSRDLIRQHAARSVLD